jgi:hypothetical protein
MIPRTRAAAARLAFAWALFATPAAAAGTQAVSYTQSPGAEFRVGCFDVAPCACPSIQNPMSGTFGLIRQPNVPPFARYDVVGAYWEVDFPNGPVTIFGSGTYRVGGTGTLQQQLTLDLVVGNSQVLHFDSGLVPGGGDFPRINADISLHGELACADTLLRVRAGPDGGTLGVDAPALSLGAVGPNPFRALTRVAFTLRDGGPVRVRIHDPAGRCVRTLADGDWFAAGTHAVEWDGTRDDGRSCAPGLYLLSVQAPGASRRASVIKLR